MKKTVLFIKNDKYLLKSGKKGTGIKITSGNFYKDIEDVDHLALQLEKIYNVFIFQIINKEETK